MDPSITPPSHDNATAAQSEYTFSVLRGSVVLSFKPSGSKHACVLITQPFMFCAVCSAPGDRLLTAPGSQTTMTTLIQGKSHCSITIIIIIMVLIITVKFCMIFIFDITFMIFYSLRQRYLMHRAFWKAGLNNFGGLQLRQAFCRLVYVFYI